ncbi:Lysine decarboxylase family [hydrothermal vent metagenome]|uniref:Lysine decarboxylase family n=1 Tax=hydrothermal vent metagenome TaxID=652676 RepID=A0A3B1DHK5_9ZZZZ
MILSVCVFCSSSESVDTVYKEMATDLGRRLGQTGLHLVYGGASIGLMGCVARGVHEFGGRVTGVLPEFFKNKNIEYGDADELIVTKDMRERKAVMDQKSDAFITLPGGIGTLEEAMEILSMKQLQLTPKPLVFINTQNFFDGLIANLQEMVDLKFAKKETLDLFAVEPDPEQALHYIQNYEPPFTPSKWL